MGGHLLLGQQLVGLDLGRPAAGQAFDVVGEGEALEEGWQNPHQRLPEEEVEGAPEGAPLEEETHQGHQGQLAPPGAHHGHDAARQQARITAENLEAQERR